MSSDDKTREWTISRTTVTYPTESGHLKGQVGDVTAGPDTCEEYEYLRGEGDIDVVEKQAYQAKCKEIERLKEGKEIFKKNLIEESKENQSLRARLELMKKNLNESCKCMPSLNQQCVACDTLGLDMREEGL